MRRHKDVLSFKRAKTVEQCRLGGTTVEALESFFIGLGDMMLKESYPPHLVINFDETSLFMKPKSPKVITARGALPAIRGATEMRYQCTLGVAITASGMYLKHLLILPTKTLPEVPLEVIPYLAWSGQPNGWIDSTILLEWAKNVLVPYVEETRISHTRALLVCDGHSTRKQEDFLSLLEAHRIDLAFLPPHSSSVTQPLDVGIYPKFKATMSRLVALNVRDEERTLVGYRAALLKSLIRGIHSACVPMDVVKSFETAGIYPVSLKPLSDPQVGSSLVSNKLQTLLGRVLTGAEVLEGIRNKKMREIQNHFENEEKKRKREEKRARKSLESLSNNSSTTNSSSLSQTTTTL